MQKGFTLIELILVLALMGIIVFVAVGFSSNAVPQNQLRSQIDIVTDYLRLAQVRSVSGRADQTWGVHLTETDITLFAGSNYVSRDIAFDEVKEFPAGITVSGLTDIVFDFRTGTTSNIGRIVFEDITGDAKAIDIYASGTIEKR